MNTKKKKKKTEGTLLEKGLEKRKGQSTFGGGHGACIEPRLNKNINTSICNSLHQKQGPTV